MRVQARHLQPGDIVVGSDEKVIDIIINSIRWPSNKVHVALESDVRSRGVLWGKYTMINVERK